MNIWQLKIILSSGTAVSICGTEDALRPGLEEYDAAIRAVDGTAEKIITVHGMCDSADRAEVALAFQPEQVAAITLTKLY